MLIRARRPNLKHFQQQQEEAKLNFHSCEHSRKCDLTLVCWSLKEVRESTMSLQTRRGYRKIASVGNCIYHNCLLFSYLSNTSYWVFELEKVPSPELATVWKGTYWTLLKAQNNNLFLTRGERVTTSSTGLGIDKYKKFLHDKTVFEKKNSIIKRINNTDK